MDDALNVNPVIPAKRPDTPVASILVNFAFGMLIANIPDTRVNACVPSTDAAVVPIPEMSPMEDREIELVRMELIDVHRAADMSPIVCNEKQVLKA